MINIQSVVALIFFYSDLLVSEIKTPNFEFRGEYKSLFLEQLHYYPFILLRPLLLTHSNY